MTRDQAPTPQPRWPDAPLSRGLRWGLAALLLLVACAVFIPALGGQFLYDDHRLIEHNRTIVSMGAALGAFFEPFWAFDPEAVVTNAFWRPLTTIVLALGRTLFAFEPAGYHALSILLHGLATLVAWRLAGRLLGSPVLGFLVALLFATHPVHVESVAWIAAVNDPLYGLFALLALDAHLAWRERGSRGVPWMTGVWFLLSLLAKEQALAVPIVALVLDLVGGRLSGESEDPFADLLRAYGTLMAAVALYYVGRVVAFGDPLAGFGEAQAKFDLGLQRALQFRVEMLGGFLERLFLPFGHEFFRMVRPELPENHGPWQRAVGFSVAWLVGVGLAIARRRRRVLAALLVAPALLVPLIAYYQAAGAYPISDRYLYVPVLFAAVVVVALCRRWVPRPVLVSGAVLLAALGGWRTAVHAQVFQDDESFYRAAVAASPDNVRVRVALGQELLKQYHRTREKLLLDEALFHFLYSLTLGKDYGEYAPKLGEDEPFIKRAKELELIINAVPESELEYDHTVFVDFPSRMDANMGVGWSTFYLGQLPPEYDLEWPELIFRQILKRVPESAEAKVGLGVVLFARGNREGAEQELREALTLNRNYPEAWHNLGLVLARREAWDEARRCHEQALLFRPDHLPDQLLAGTCALEAERWEIAASWFDAAERMHPESVEPTYHRGVMYARRGDLAKAVEYFDQVLAQEPNHAASHLNRGTALLGMQDIQGAIRSYRRACELTPENFEAHYALTSLLLANPEAAEDAVPYLQRTYELSPPDARRQILHVTLKELIRTDMARVMAMARLAERRGDYIHALDWVDLALADEASWTDPQIRAGRVLALSYQRGKLLSALQRFSEALTSIQRTLAIDPDHFGANHDAALLLAGPLEQPALAKEHATRALEAWERISESLDPMVRNAMRRQLQSIADWQPPMGPPLEEDGK